MKKYVIIVAGGYGSRFGSSVPKQFLQFSGKPVLLHTLEKFYSYNSDIQIIIVLQKEYFELWKKICSDFNVNIPHKLVEGGRERFFSVRNGLQNTDADSIVAIHDGVRPFVSFQTLDNCFNTAELKGNAVPAVPISDSVRLVGKKSNRTLIRDKIRLVQTPQVFHSNIIKEAYKEPYSDLYTDDASVLETLKYRINLVEGNIENIKITTPFDLILAESIFCGQHLQPVQRDNEVEIGI